jgi:hypothetical protein
LHMSRREMKGEDKGGGEVSEKARERDTLTIIDGSVEYIV